MALRSVPVVPLIAVGIGSLLSIRLLRNVFARFLDYWFPQSDRTIARKIVRWYAICVYVNVAIIALGAALFEMRIIF